MLRDVWNQVRRRREEPSAPDEPVDSWSRISVRGLINLVSDGDEDRPIVINPWTGRVTSVEPGDFRDGVVSSAEGGEWPGTAGVLSYAAVCARAVDMTCGWLFDDRYKAAEGTDLQDELDVMASWAPVRVTGDLGADGWVYRLPREIKWKPGVNADPVPLFVVLGPRESDPVWCGTLASLRRKVDVTALWGDWWRSVEAVAEGMVGE